MDEFYHHMLAKEKEFRKYEFQPKNNKKYIAKRWNIVHLTWRACDNLNLETSIAHISVHYFDKIMSLYSVQETRWNIILASCISVAMKYGVTDDHHPSISSLIKVMGLDGLSNSYFRDSGEIVVLQLLDWRLCCLPPVMFIDYYLEHGILFTDEIYESEQFETLKLFQEYVHFFCFLCLKNYTFCFYRPSMLASAIIFVTRQMLGTHPWRTELKALTGFDEHDLQSISCHILASYQEEYPEHYQLVVGQSSTSTYSCANDNYRSHDTIDQSLHHSFKSFKL